MAPHAIVELLSAVDLIEKGAVSSGRARSGLVGSIIFLFPFLIDLLCKCDGFHLVVVMLDKHAQKGALAPAEVHVALLFCGDM